MSIEPYLFNAKTAAEYLGIAQRTVEEYIAKGWIELMKLPSPDGSGLLRRRLIAREELHRFVRERSEKI